ncbi:MAG TPA: scytonemin biosynthesis cyclase/decarboxylase ScyC [Bryobacteraceae bacterium]|nr:scytonemin biosynthesis cyclase/decarboxylase ScyC [Bryobacteraceae bacterium]
MSSAIDGTKPRLARARHWNGEREPGCLIPQQAVAVSAEVFMEANTFATSAFIAVPQQTAYDYLCRLKNLDEWTLGSRMKEQVDEDTWIGTASGYQRTLYYHVRRLENPRFRGIEWQCGYEYQKYFKSYPVLLFPPDYVEPGSTESGVYFHWVSVIDPVQRTPMIMQGIQTVHNSEARSLKAVLERRAGLTEAAQGLYRIEADTIYINAPIEMAAEFMGDLRTMETWSHLLKPAGSIERERGVFLDEYGQTVEVTLRTNQLEDYYLVEQDYFHPQHNSMQRSPTFLIPLPYAFGDASAPGILLHRITFWKNGAAQRHGKLTIDDFGAENMNIKRLLEAKAGNLATFALGKSYVPVARAAGAK